MSQLFMSLQDLPEYKYECLDALDFCKNLDSESAGLIMTSPPYNIGKSYEKTARKPLALAMGMNGLI